jgi:hypothetical protein
VGASTRAARLGKAQHLRCGCHHHRPLGWAVAGVDSSRSHPKGLRRIANQILIFSSQNLNMALIDFAPLMSI